MDLGMRGNSCIDEEPCNRAISEETSGFASPPHDGFACALAGVSALRPPVLRSARRRYYADAGEHLKPSDRGADATW
jgi:hypothetical protein